MFWKLTLQRVEHLSFALWLVKDISWVLLIPFIAWPASLGTIIAEVYLILNDSCVSVMLRGHRVAALLWLIGNAIWMTAEVLWDDQPLPPGKQFRWWKHQFFPERMAGAEYQTCLVATTALFMMSIVILVSLYCNELRSSYVEGQASEQPASNWLVFGLFSVESYKLMFLLPWVTKDLFWVWEYLWPCLFFDCVTITILADVARRFGSSCLPIILWAAAGAIWMIQEEAWADQVVAPRFLAFVMLVAALGLHTFGPILSLEGRHNELDNHVEESYGSLSHTVSH